MQFREWLLCSAVGTTVHYGGLSSHLVKERAKQVYELAVWAKQNGFKKMYAA